MIKVALYEFSYEWENDEPTMVLSLKEFEKKFNEDRFKISDFHRIEFIIV